MSKMSKTNSKPPLHGDPELVIVCHHRALMLLEEVRGNMCEISALGTRMCSIADEDEWLEYFDKELGSEVETLLSRAEDAMGNARNWAQGYLAPEAFHRPGKD